MKWALVIITLLLTTGCAQGERKPHQQDAIERIQKIFRPHYPPPIPPVIEPVIVPPAPVIVPKIEQPKSPPKIEKSRPPRPEPKPEPKPKPRAQVQVSASDCAQIAMGVRFFGVAGMKQKARERGYSSGQIAAAMRACGYS